MGIDEGCGKSSMKASHGSGQSCSRTWTELLTPVSRAADGSDHPKYVIFESQVYYAR